MFEFRLRFVSLILAVLSLLALPVNVVAQTAQFSYAQMTLGGGFSSPQGVAVDTSGNIFVTDTLHDAVKEIPVGCFASSCTVTLATGIYDTVGIAVDGQGNLFVADTDYNRVIEIAASGGYKNITTLAAAFTFVTPKGIALDSSGNVYVADQDNNAVYRIVKAGGYTEVDPIGSGFKNPVGVAVDSSGNVYVSEVGYNSVAVEEIVASNGSTSASSSVKALGGGFSDPQDVAVDASGNVYVSDSTYSYVKEIPSGCKDSTCVVSLGSGLSSPIGVTVDANGKIYVADYNHNRIEELQKQSANFGTVAVGQTSASIPLTFSLSGADTLSTPVALTMGATGLDFAIASGGTCAGLTYTSGQTCTVNVTFTPKHTGTRYGAVVLYDSSSPANVAGTAYMTGFGQGAQASFQPGTLSSQLMSSTNGATNWFGGLVVDGSENLYLADGDEAVWLLTAPASGTNYTTSLLGGKNSSNIPNITYDCPQFTAVDGAGNIYVADYGCMTNHPAVYQLALQANGSYIKNLLGGSWVNPMGVAVDSIGNVYVADIGTGFVSKLTLSNGSYTQAVIASGISSVDDLAVDVSGNIYVASDSSTASATSSIIKLTPSGTSYTHSTIGSGWNEPSEIAIDGNGNLIVSDVESSGTVLKLTPQTDGSYVKSAIIAYAKLPSPVGVAVDGAGNTFIVDSAYTNVYKLDIIDGPTLNFPTATAHGSLDTVDGTLTATIQNIGNQPLTFSSIVASTNFQLDSGKTTCSTSSSLAVNATCVIGVDFYPTTSGALKGTVTLTDNSPNATQTISLSGSGSVLPPAPTIATASEPASRTTVTTAAFTFSDTLSGVTFLCSLDSATFAACTSPANYSSLTLATHSFSVEAEDGSGNISAPATYSWTVIAPPPAPTIITGPATTTTATTASFSFLDSQSNVSYQCSLDSAPYVACGAAGNPTGIASYSSLALGPHTFTAEAVDAYGNVSSPTPLYSWTIITPPVSVTIDTNPDGLSYTVDGTSYTSAAYLFWTVGSTHTIATTASQTPTGIQATFTSWSDGGALSHTVTAAASTTSYTANFTASYQLTTAANPSGSGTVLPASGTYYPSGTVVNLTASSGASYTFGNWSGSVAGVTSAATTVTMNTPQSVAANFYSSSILLPEWAWEADSSTRNQSGAYVTKSAFSANNLPGGRTPAASGTDSSGHLWIFGGKGYDSAGTLGDLNDLWIFNPSSGWEWVSGSKIANAAGVLSGTGANPGSRENAIGWTDSSGNFWLFGGYGYDVSGTKGGLNDLWEYNSSKGWVFVGGNSTIGNATGVGGQLGIYGTLNTYDPLNLPGSREYAIGWADSSGNLWLFGGEGGDSKGSLGYLNDLWEFSPSQGTSGEWKWMGGSSVASKNSASYGPLGTPGATYIPGGRLSSLSWTDKSGNFWLFGGEGYDSTGAFRELNDLWEYVPPTSASGGTGTWTWVSVSNTITSFGVYGTLGTPAAANVPGSRLDATGWVDSSGNLWLLGGLGLDVNGNNTPYGEPLSDLWEFNTSTKLWTWMNGSNTMGDPGIYGTQGTPAAGNMPGSRYFATSWVDGSGNPWLFGGYGKDGSGNYGYLNDVWEYGHQPPPAPSINSGPANPTTAITAAFSFTDTQSNVTYQCSMDNGAYTACVSGVSYPSLAAGGHSFAVEAVDSSNSVSTPASYSWTITATPPPVPAINSEPANPTTATTAAFTFSDTQSGVTFQCSLDNVAYTACTSGISYSSLAVGAHSFSVEAVAGAGNNSSAATYSWTITATPPPVPAINSEPANPTTATTAAFTFSDTQSGVTFQCSLDSVAYTTCTSGISYSSLAVGAHSFSVEAVAGAGNNSSAATYSWTINATVQVTVGTAPAGLSFSVDGTSYTSAPTLTWTVGSSHTIVANSPQTSGGTQNTFASWSDGGAITHSVTAAAGTTSYTATYSTAYQLTTAVSPSGSGTALPATGTYSAAGTVVNLSATPNSGYTFSNWTGSVASATSAATTVTMTAPQSVIANFTATVVPPAITFSVGSITPTQSVQPGGVATYSINVNSQNGSYTNAVTLSASGLPTNATASFSLNPVTPGAAGATSLLTIQTAAQVASNASAGLAWPLAAPALAFIGIFFVPGKRRRRWITLGALLIASLGALSALSGCGGGFSGHQSAATNYTITVTGTSGTTVQTTTVQLTVQ